jgi:hypothetical protein
MYILIGFIMCMMWKVQLDCNLIPHLTYAQ